MSQQFYQVGGSLSANSKSYIKRDADDKLLKYLKEGKYCYVLNARQVGKSSLRVYTSKRLEDDGYHCINIDLTSIGSEDITVDEWYFSFILHIVEQLSLDEDAFAEWWDENSKLTVVNRFAKIFDKFILKESRKKIIIFIDEVDYILGIRKDFSADDFFAVIRTFYNLRSEDKRYNRVSFALFGVATPEELMRDSTRTPFNVAHQVTIKPFKFYESLALVEGINNQKIEGKAILERVFKFTGGTPFLTQKLLDYISDNPIDKLDDIDDYVEILFIKENFKETNLSNIQNRIISNQKYNMRMFTIIDKLINDSEVKADDRDITQIYLKLSGLVKEENGKLVFTNKIYNIVFNKEWLSESLSKVDRPFLKDLQRWIELERVDSALISGEVLVEANKWSSGRDDLSVDENEFLRISFKFEKENELKEEKKKAQSKQIKTLGVSLFVAILIGIGLVYFYLESQKQKKEAVRQEREALKQEKKAVRYKEESHNFALQIKKTESELKTKEYKSVEKKDITKYEKSAIPKDMYDVSIIDKIKIDNKRDNNDTVQLIIPDETQQKLPLLVKMIRASKSMNNRERNYWLQVLPVMTKPQQRELFDILKTEMVKLNEIDLKYSILSSQNNIEYIFDGIKGKKIITDSAMNQLIYRITFINKSKFSYPLYQKFINKFESIQHKVQSKDKYFHLLARFYLQIGEYDKSLNRAERSIKLNNTNYRVYSDMGKVYNNQKKYNKAIEFYKKAMALNFEDDRLYYDVGVFYQQREEYLKSTEMFKKSIIFQPKNKTNMTINGTSIDKSYNYMGWNYYKLKKYDKAIESYQKAIDANPKKGQYYLAIASMYNIKKEYALAIKMYNKSLKIDPNFASSYTDFFEIQLTQNITLDKKIEKKYIKLFKSKKRTFIYYEMLKIFEKIILNKKIYIEKWEIEYKDTHFSWNFDILDKWIETIEDKDIKKRLLEAIKVFKNHKEKTKNR
jgi:tetratricopeptide (TPR) repeat protein